MSFYNKIKLTYSKLAITTVIILALIVSGIYFNSLKLNKVGNLHDMWSIYKKAYIDHVSGRTIDHQQGGITTSEGQSYTMLRSVWMNDKNQFDSSWQWTKNNLKRPKDSLFAWQWGLKKDGGYGIITDNGGGNIAVDADIDIAYSLILASQKWDKNNTQKYMEEAKKMIYDIWNLAVIKVDNGKLILGANNLEKELQKINPIVNPSYFSAFSFREFAKITPELEWTRLAQDSYFVLNKIMDIKIAKKPLVLPPDWITINTKTMDINQLADKPFAYSYDAMRIPWRVAMDYYINKSPEAIDFLKRLEFFNQEWKNKNTIYTEYSSTGEISGNYESTLAYSTSLSYFDIINPAVANTIYDKKLQPKIFDKLGYYESNWLWFSLLLYYKAF